MADSEDRYLEIEGIIHRLLLCPVGPERGSPWPFVLYVETATGGASAMIHKEDAEMLIEFFTRHLDDEPASAPGDQSARSRGE